jgi:hypothetical protein
MYIIHRPVFYFKHVDSETGFCLGLQVELSWAQYLKLVSISEQQ